MFEALNRNKLSSSLPYCLVFPIENSKELIKTETL